MDTCAALTRRVDHLEFDKVAQALEITKLKKRVKKLERRNKVRVLKLKRLQRVRTSQRVETSDEIMMDDVSNQERMTAKVDADVDVVLEGVKEAADEAKEVAEDAKVDEIPAAPARVTTAPSRKRKGVVIKDPEEESTTSTIIPAETKSKDKGKGILVEELKPLKKKQQIELDEQYARELHAELNKDIDWDEVIDHVKIKAKEDRAVKKFQALKRKPQTEAQARKNMMLYLKNVAGCKMDYLKGMSYDDICPIFEAKFNSNIITFTTTQLILLVERKYLLTRFTLDQMLNDVRLKVKEESEVSLELLRFTRQQHQEGQLE
uniref:Uncharacterized protein n=1 Tax=Tanacetum cinerariifolium TaxID=118510 RepID=A0A699HWH1_TANCI|nr:hypothetical protein [Tanacetum cinerariifolium]